MILLFLSLLLAYWFKYEITAFPVKTNQQSYNDIKMLYPLNLDINAFIKQSNLQPKYSSLNNLFFLTLPITLFIFYSLSHPLLFILFILIYLAQLDYYYYLTDIKYIAIIFLLVIYHLLFETSEDIYPHLFSFFIISLFFTVIIPLVNLILKKSGLGLGDILLFIALSPLFELDQMLRLILYASLLGLFFSGLYWLMKKQKIARLPFIPFISASTFLLFIDKIPP